jgi:hypothetical protein
MHLSHVPRMASGNGTGGSQIARRNLLGQVFHRILLKFLKHWSMALFRRAP